LHGYGPKRYAMWHGGRYGPVIHTPVMPAASFITHPDQRSPGRTPTKIQAYCALLNSLYTIKYNDRQCAGIWVHRHSAIMTNRMERPE